MQLRNILTTVMLNVLALNIDTIPTSASQAMTRDSAPLSYCYTSSQTLSHIIHDSRPCRLWSLLVFDRIG